MIQLDTSVSMMKSALKRPVIWMSLQAAMFSTGANCQSNPRPLVVSMIQLIATPERFDGKLVSVVGFLRLSQEANLLYFDKSSYDNVMLENTLWLDPTEEMERDREHLEMKYVRIEGIFRLGNKMRNNVSAGGITDIKSCEFYSDPAHPLEDRIKAMHN